MNTYSNGVCGITESVSLHAATTWDTINPEMKYSLADGANTDRRVH